MAPRLRCPAASGLGAAIRKNASRIPSRHAAVLLFSPVSSTPSLARNYAAPAAARAPLTIPNDYVPPTKPPTARPSDVRKSQLLRSYTSLLRSTPLMLVFQHSNLTAVEWSAVRRELRLALANVPPQGLAQVDISPKISLQVIRTRIFDVALKIVEFFDPSKVKPTTTTSITGAKIKTVYNHDLSEAAYKAIKAAEKSDAPSEAADRYNALAPLLVGPMAILTFPAVSPAHLAAALSILAPSPPAFPAPGRKKNPGYYDPIMQSGLQKLMLVGGRVDGDVFDIDGMKRVGGIEGGIDSLRAQLVHLLQSAGMGLTSTLEGAGKSLWLTMESRRSVLDEEQNPKEVKEEVKGEAEKEAEKAEA